MQAVLPISELVAQRLTKDGRGSYALSPCALAEIKHALAAIGDPTLFKDTLSELIQLACFFATEGQHLSAARALLRIAESACVRLVAIGAQPEGFGPDAKNVLQDYRRLTGDDRPKYQPKADARFQTMKVKEVLSWQRIK